MNEKLVIVIYIYVCVGTYNLILHNFKIGDNILLIFQLHYTSNISKTLFCSALDC